MSRGRLGIDFGAQGGHFGDQNDDFLSPWDHLGPFGESLGSPGLPWAAQLRKKMQNLVRGSPQGNPKGGQTGPTKLPKRGPKSKKGGIKEAEVRFWTFFCCGSRVEKNEKIEKQ